MVYLDVMVEVLVLLVADVAGWRLPEVDLLDVVLQRVLSHKLLLAQRALGHLHIFYSSENRNILWSLAITKKNFKCYCWFFHITLLWQCSLRICQRRFPTGKKLLQSWHSTCSKVKIIHKYWWSITGSCGTGHFGTPRPVYSRFSFKGQDYPGIPLHPKIFH